jgi:hypothetical protein
MQVIRQTEFTQCAALDITLHLVGGTILLYAGYMQVYTGASLQKRLEAFGKQLSPCSGQLESLSKTIVSEKRRFPNQGTGTVIYELLQLLTQLGIKIVITIQQGGPF